MLLGSWGTDCLLANKLMETTNHALHLQEGSVMEQPKKGPGMPRLGEVSLGWVRDLDADLQLRAGMLLCLGCCKSCARTGGTSQRCTKQFSLTSSTGGGELHVEL